MVIVALIVVVVLVVLFALVARSRFATQKGDEVELTARAVAPGADVEHNFERPRAQDEPPL
jgi:uncharacterized membrane protein